MRRGLEPDTAYIMRQVSNRPDGSFGFAEVLSARLFPNHRGVYWTGRAREEILPAARAQGLRTKFVDIPVTHLGFAHPASVLRSLLRDRELLQADLGERPDNPLLLFNLALTHFLIGRCASSLDDVGISRRYLEKLLEGRCESLTPDLEGAVFALLAHAFLALGNIARSLEICEEFRLLHPSDFALVDVEASLLADLGMWERAEALYLRLPQIRDYIHMRDLGHARYHRLVSAKVAAAYHFEGTGQHCRAFLTWSELVDNSAGMFDAARGRRRTALRILRNAILNPMEFLGEIARLRKSGPAPSGPQAGAVAAFRRRNDVPKGSRGRSPTF